MKKIIFGLLLASLIGAVFYLSSQDNSNAPSSKPYVQDVDLSYETHPFMTDKGEPFSLSLPSGYTISLAASGLGRARFMAMSPDGRLFVTDMKNLSDNTEGKIYVLDKFNEQTKQFDSKKIYLSRLRNPNSIAFYKDSAGRTWIYIALTDRLIRYLYVSGEDAPRGEPETLATYPDYGLSYKYGGWHLTRTVHILNDKLYVSVGSSCNSCEEKESEPLRATITQMNPDGTGEKILATGLRNAVGLASKDNELYASAMGADHLGDDRPEEALYKIRDGANYGWPYCYQYQGAVYADYSQKWQRSVDCSSVPLALSTFPAHVAPLGLEYFDARVSSELTDSFLLALHGSSNISLGRGYKIIRIDKEGNTKDFVTGFLRDGVSYGRPAGILKASPASFYFTDDYFGRLYFVSKPNM